MIGDLARVHKVPCNMEFVSNVFLRLYIKIRCWTTCFPAVNTLDSLREEIKLFETSKLFWCTKNQYCAKPRWEDSLQKCYAWSKLKKNNSLQISFLQRLSFVALKPRLWICANVQLLFLSPSRTKERILKNESWKWSSCVNVLNWILVLFFLLRNKRNFCLFCHLGTFHMKLRVVLS